MSEPQFGAAPLRKKRVFQVPGLSLDPITPAPQPSRAAPAPKGLAGKAGGPGKKRPVALTLAAPKLPTKPSSHTEDGMLTIGSTPAGGSQLGTAGVGPETTSPFRSNYQNTLTQQLEELSLGKVAIKGEDLKEVSELGAGNGGSVKKVLHVPTGTTMAKKIVLIDGKPAVRKQILRELNILHQCHDPHIVAFYGAFVADPNVCMCLEFMDRGSLDGIYKKHGPIPIDIVGKIAWAVLKGLTYLYDVHRIIHRDIKPSNILANSQGEIKVCDFGVSGELINSVADTFVGTSTYMSPERIQGAQYSVKSDVWSLGISLIELALGRFPFSEADSDVDENDSDLEDLEATLSPARPDSYISAIRQTPVTAIPKKTNKKDKRKSKGVSLQGGGMTMSILELLQHIVNEPAPKLVPEGKFPGEAEEFVDTCLKKDPGERKTPTELLNFPWMKYTYKNQVDLVAWASAL